MKPVKVGFLTPSLMMGGAERWILSLARNCDPTRIQWTGTVLCEWAHSSPKLAEELARYMPIYAGPDYNTPTTQTETHIERFLPDASVPIGRLATCSEVIISWGTYHLDKMLYNYITGSRLRSVSVSHCEGPAQELAPYEAGATHFVAVCDVAKQIYSPNTQKKCEVIHNGADVHRITPTVPREVVRTSWGFKPTDVLIGYLGRLSPEKNPIAVAKGVKQLPSNYHAVFVGEGWMATEIQKEVKELIPNQCLFVPSMQQVGNAIQAFDVMALTSYTEAFSLSMIEAWLAGVPIIVTPVGVLRELEHLYGSMMVTLPYDPQGPQVAIGILEATSGKGAYFAKKCRKIAWENYTTAAMAERWTSYLERITDRTSIPTANCFSSLWCKG